MLEYKGYFGDVELDVDAGILHGRLLGIRTIVMFESDSIEGIRREFRVSVDDYLKLCEEEGRAPERPFSGKFNVRVEPNLHRALVMAARARQVSMNEFIEQTLTDAVGLTVPSRIVRAEAGPDLTKPAKRGKAPTAKRSRAGAKTG